MQIDLLWRPGDSTACWSFAGHQIRKEHALPLQSATYVADPPSVVLVEEISSSGPTNAVVYELDGRERVRLRPPDLSTMMGFDQVFQSSAGVVAVVITRQGDFQGEPDLISGELRNIRDWR